MHGLVHMPAKRRVVTNTIHKPLLALRNCLDFMIQSLPETLQKE